MARDARHQNRDGIIAYDLQAETQLHLAQSGAERFWSAANW